MILGNTSVRICHWRDRKERPLSENHDIMHRAPGASGIQKMAQWRRAATTDIFLMLE
jgi:hypothetical protein